MSRLSYEFLGRTSQRPTEPIAVDPTGQETYDARERSIHVLLDQTILWSIHFPIQMMWKLSLEVQEDLRRQFKFYFEILAHIAEMQLEMTQPNEAMFTVAVESLTPGHRVPTGLTSERQM